MAKPVKPPAGAPATSPAKRSYNSDRRQAQARETQRQIAEAARELFIGRGYAATSIRDIADHAGVAVQTIYNAFDGKPGIVNRIADMAVVGDDEPVALMERAEIEALMGLTDPVELIERWVSFTMGIFTRFLPLLPFLREAAASEPVVAERYKANALDHRYQGTLGVAHQLAGIGGLPKGLTPDAAADVLWTVVSFESVEALMGRRGYTADDCATTLATVVLGYLGLHRSA